MAALTHLRNPPQEQLPQHRTEHPFKITPQKSPLWAPNPPWSPLVQQGKICRARTSHMGITSEMFIFLSPGEPVLLLVINTCCIRFKQSWRSLTAWLSQGQFSVWCTSDPLSSFAFKAKVQFLPAAACSFDPRGTVGLGWPVSDLSWQRAFVGKILLPSLLQVPFYANVTSN